MHTAQMYDILWFTDMIFDMCGVFMHGSRSSFEFWATQCPIVKSFFQNTAKYIEASKLQHRSTCLDGDSPKAGGGGTGLCG